MVESFKLSRICQWSGEISGIKGLPGGKENPILELLLKKRFLPLLCIHLYT